MALIAALACGGRFASVSVVLFVVLGWRCTNSIMRTYISRVLFVICRPSSDNRLRVVLDLLHHHQKLKIK
jgi:hypothetical protein